MNFLQRPELNNIYTGFLQKEVIQDTLIYIDKIKKRITATPYKCKCYTSDNITENILNDQRLQKLHFNILAHIRDYMVFSGSYYEGFIDKSWFNIYHKDFFQEYHSHLDPINRFICGIVYFTDSPESATQFYFRNTITVKPEIGKIVLFPDEVEHRVVVNEKDTTRVSLALNYRKCVQWYGLKKN